MLLAIFGFAFLFRAAVIFHNEYPPSSDIGLHGSIINLILDEGKLPSWNPYHMGGEPLATPPGFHFFVSILILFTGMPLLLAQLVTAAFFSSFIVFPAYLVSRKMWNSHSAGFLAAFFAAISALSIEMISWGGYTNVVSLALMVLFFYLFLRDMDQPSPFHLLMGMLIFGSLLISHTFSLFVFFPILILYFVFLLMGKALKIKKIELRKTLRFFTVSVALGILAVSPWILRVFSFYLGASEEGALLGGVEANRDIILANRSLDTIILTLIVVLIPAFFMFRASRKSYADNGSLLLVAWFLVPVVMTQAYIFGVFVDYSRFMYFIDFPGILLIAAGLFYLFHYTSIAVNKLPKLRWNSAKKLAPALVFIVAIFVFIVVSPWSIFPDEAMERVNFYTTIQKPEATAMDWIQNRTPESSVLVADHLYGWWLSGIGKRTTLSAAGLEFLLYSHEMEVAKSAHLLFDTNYYIDNGLIQVREDGLYLSRYNPAFSIESWNGKAYPLIHFKDNETIFFCYWIDNHGQRVYVNTTLADMQMVGNPALVQNENWAALTTMFENDFFTVNKTVTVQRGARFAELSYEIDVKSFRTDLFNIRFKLITREDTEPPTIDRSIPMIGFYDPNLKACGQAIFREDLPVELDKRVNPNRFDLLYRYEWSHEMKIQILVGVFDAADLDYPKEVEETYYSLVNSSLETVSFDPLITWDYSEMIETYDISYVVCRDQTVYSKFSENPNFRLVFNGGNVAVFQVAK
jgi:hypothetical protein